MGKKSYHSFVKRQKELKRARKAQEKMERRQAKKNAAEETDYNPEGAEEILGDVSEASENHQEEESEE